MTKPFLIYWYVREDDDEEENRMQLLYRGTCASFTAQTTVGIGKSKNIIL